MPFKAWSTIKATNGLIGNIALYTCTKAGIANDGKVIPASENPREV